jgi:hypothetical protein
MTASSFELNGLHPEQTRLFKSYWRVKMDSVAISILLSYCIFISLFVMGVFLFSPFFFFEFKFIIASSKLYFFFEGFSFLYTLLVMQSTF